jgi:hypothetical protein
MGGKGNEILKKKKISKMFACYFFFITFAPDLVTKAKLKFNVTTKIFFKRLIMK